MNASLDLANNMSQSYQEIEFVISSDKIRFIHDGAGLPFIFIFGPENHATYIYLRAVLKK